MTLNAVAAASKIGGEITCLVAGHGCGAAAKAAGNIAGVSRVLLADFANLKGFFPEYITPLVVASQNQFQFNTIIAGATAYGKVMLLISFASTAICIFSQRFSFMLCNGLLLN